MTGHARKFRNNYDTHVHVFMLMETTMAITEPMREILFDPRELYIELADLTFPNCPAELCSWLETIKECCLQNIVNRAPPLEDIPKNTTRLRVTENQKKARETNNTLLTAVACANDLINHMGLNRDEIVNYRLLDDLLFRVNLMELAQDEQCPYYLAHLEFKREHWLK